MAVVWGDFDLLCHVPSLPLSPAESLHRYLIPKISSDNESGIEQSSPPSSSLPNKERHIERIANSRGIRTFLIMDHTANLRKNSRVSAIWHHGGERRRIVTKATNKEDDPLGPDELQKFIYATTVTKNDAHWNPINWWIKKIQKGNYDTLHLHALDYLSCPAIAMQCKRVFSAARRALAPVRNALRPKILEACECLRW